MRVLIALSSFLLGASLADKLINKFIPDVDFDNEDCLGDACFLRNQLLSVDRSKTDPTTNLAYNERTLAYAKTQELLRICLPNIEKFVFADSFTSCKDKKMEDICVFTKRRWLVKDAQEESVANVDLLTTAFSFLGEDGDEAVKKCLNIKEEADEYDDDEPGEYDDDEAGEYDDDEYEYYDYADYYDEYDYLEEGAGVERRIRREAGNGGKSGKKGDKNGNGKANGSKGKKNNKKKGKNSDGRKGKKNNKKNGGRKGKKNKGKNEDGRNLKDNGGKKKSVKNKGNNNSNKKNGKGKKNSKPDDRKYVKKPTTTTATTTTVKKPSKNVAKISARLNQLGLKNLPVKSTLDGLECMWNELEDLLVKCGEQIVSNSPGTI